MKAIVYTQYGPPDVLKPGELEKPVPGEDEILIRIYATTVTAGDYRIRGFIVPAEFWLFARFTFGLLRPKYPVLGTEFSGEVEAVGKAVRLFKQGDRVFGIDGQHFGAYAEYVCKPENAVLSIKPSNMSYEEAATVPFGMLTALYFLRDMGKIQSGQNVLIYGASGGVGTAAVQLARYFGAHVCGVCSTANMELVYSLGADRVLDYTREDFTGSDERYDLIFDTVGKAPYEYSRKSLKPNGVYLSTVFGIKQLLQMLWTAIAGASRAIYTVAPERTDDLIFIKELIEAGEIQSVIDRRYPLEQAADAHAYAEHGHKKGNVVLVVR